MYIVYEHTRKNVSYWSGKGLPESKIFGYIKDVLFFKSLPKLKKYIESKTLELLISSETPYIQTENVKFAEKYLTELESYSKTKSCTFSDNYISVYKLKVNNGLVMIGNDYITKLISKESNYDFISSDGVHVFDKDDFFNYEERMRYHTFETELYNTKYFTKECILKLKSIIEELHLNSYYIEEFEYSHKDTGQKFTIDDVLLYNFEKVAYCRNIFGKTHLINLNELIIL